MRHIITLVIFLCKMGEIRNAELALEKAQKINPSSDEITENLIIFYRTFNKLKKAYSLINKISKIIHQQNQNF